MPFTKLSQENIDKIRQLRGEGRAIESIADELRLSVGVCSKYSRDIPRPRTAKVVHTKKEPKQQQDKIDTKITPGDILEGDFPDDIKEQASEVTHDRLALQEIKTERDRLKVESEIAELKQQEAIRKNPEQRYSVRHDGIIYVDNEAGEYSFNQALKVSENYRLGDGHKPSGESGRGDKDPEEKFTVTADGEIETATGAKLTQGEAEAIATQIRARKKEDAIGTSKNGEDEGKLTFDAVGNIVVAEGARLSLSEAAMYAMIQKSRQQGDSRSDLQIIQDKLAEQETLDELRGRKKDGGSNLDETTKLFDLMMKPMQMQMTQISTMMADALKANTTAVEKLGQTKEETPEVKALREQNKEILSQLQALRDEQHKAEIAELQKQVTTLANRPSAGTKDVVDVISEGFAGVKEVIMAAGGHLGPAVASKLSGAMPRTPGQQHIIDVSKNGLRSTLKAEKTQEATNSVANQLKTMVDEITKK